MSTIECEKYNSTECEKYDSTLDTLNHQNRVRDLCLMLLAAIENQVDWHDESKFYEPEKSLFDKYTPLLKDSTYGSEEYLRFLEELQPALKHHYANNRHHPEFFDNGINGMTLIDIIEMFCDWKAASERHSNGSFEKSVEYNRKRFNMSDQLYQIFENTRKEMRW